MNVSSGEATEVDAIADADAGDEESGIGPLRLRRLSRNKRKRGGPETKTHARDRLDERRHPFLHLWAGSLPQLESPSATHLRTNWRRNWRNDRCLKFAFGG